MERKIKKVGKKYHVWDEVLGWVVVDRVKGLNPIQPSPVEYQESKVLTLNDVERL